MKKIVLTILALAMVAVGCGAPKAEVPKAKEAEGILIQAAVTLDVVYSSLKNLDDDSALYLNDSFDIDLVGEQTTFSDFQSGLETFSSNTTLNTFLADYYGEIADGITYGKSYNRIKDFNKKLDEQFTAVFGSNTKDKPWSEDLLIFCRYCFLEVVVKIMNEKNYKRIALLYQGNEYEDINNRRARISRIYRQYPLQFIFDKIFKAKLDVMIDDSKTKENGEYYEKMYDMIMEYLDDLRDKVKEGPYRDFVK